MLKGTLLSNWGGGGREEGHRFHMVGFNFLTERSGIVKLDLDRQKFCCLPRIFFFLLSSIANSESETIFWVLGSSSLLAGFHKL
jgi:hypothetical protein